MQQINRESDHSGRERPAFLGQATPRVVLTKSDAAYVEIRARILSCDLLPGSPIDQELLASWFGSSTTPIREALRRLESEQMVVMRAHSEVRVAPVSVEEFQEFHAIRLGLEPLAAAEAAARATPELLETLRGLIGGSVTIENELHGSRAFHRIIYTAAGNLTLTQILDSIWDRISRYRVILNSVGSASSCDSPEHRALVDALEAGNSDLTKSLIVEDLERSYQSLFPNLEAALEKFQQ